MSPGVRQVRTDPETVAALYAEDGWRVGVMAPVHSTRTFHDAVAAALGFPDYYGHNLDALVDCLADLVEPTALVVSDWTAFAGARPERWQPILEILAERAATSPPFAVLLA